MTTAKWKRYKRQEGGNVFRWFEKGKTIASVVEGYFPTEANIRITGRGFDSIEIRGHKSVILKWSDAELMRKFDTYIKREKEREKEIMTIKKISAEKVNRDKSKWYTTLSLKSAKSRAGRKQIYRTPSGVYVWRK